VTKDVATHRRSASSCGVSKSYKVRTGTTKKGVMVHKNMARLRIASCESPGGVRVLNQSGLDKRRKVGKKEVAVTAPYEKTEKEEGSTKRTRGALVEGTALFLDRAVSHKKKVCGGKR